MKIRLMQFIPPCVTRIEKVVAWELETNDTLDLLTVTRNGDSKTIRVRPSTTHIYQLDIDCVHAIDMGRGLLDRFAGTSPHDARAFEILQLMWDYIEGVDCSRTIGVDLSRTTEGSSADE